MKRFVLLGLCAGMAAMVFSSYNNGPWGGGNLNRTGNSGSGGNCGGAGCHANNTTATTPTIQVLDASNQPITNYTPGTTYKVVVGGTNTSSLAKFGFQATCVKSSSTNTQAGTFTSTASNISVRTAATPNLVEHNTPLSGTSGTYSASFNWTAPAKGTGDVTFFLTLNAVNGNGSESGDAPANTFKQFGEAPSAGVGNTAASVTAIYPNPVAGELHIKTGKPGNSAFVSISDAAGRLVSSAIVNIVNGEAVVNTSALPAGNYLIAVLQNGERYGMSFTRQ